MTIEDNDTGQQGDGGGIGSVPAGQTFTVQGSILARNTGDGGVGPYSCGHARAPDQRRRQRRQHRRLQLRRRGRRQIADPQLSAALVNAGGQTDVFTIPATSPAFDRVPGCAGADQRDFGRPQGPACDSGAYEIDQAPDTALSGTGPTFTFSSPEPGVTFQCRLDPAAFAPCTSPMTYSGLAPGAYTFVVRAVDATGNVDPTPASQAFTVQEPAPQFHRTVVVKELQRPGARAQEGQPPVRRAQRRRRASRSARPSTPGTAWSS